MTVSKMKSESSIRSNDNGKRSKKRPFPFTTIIVTNPDAASAKSAQKLLDYTLKQYLKAHASNGDNIDIISTCDPYGARCGSFGGTLAALELIRKPDSASPSNALDTVLCLHAGGDSSRCPLSMILGKAWTNLPSQEYRNPIAWLIHQLEDLFYRAKIPHGSLLVTATDCLISLGNSEPEDYLSAIPDSDTSVNPSTVLGVAVPAPLTTAKNHGVFIMPESTLPQSAGDSPSAAANFKIETPVEVWQKPSIDQLQNTNSGSPPPFFDVSARSGKQAWIDVGIVIFFPKAFQTILQLADGLLSMCTRKGLEKAYQRDPNKNSPSAMDAFAKSNALKVDLYTDILHNLPLGEGSTTTLSTENESDSIQTSLRKILSSLPLQVLAVPEGSFLHLGTTRELIEFITTTTSANRASSSIPSIMDQHVTQSLAKALQLNRRFQSFFATKKENCDNNRNNTTLCSTFPSITRLGSSTFVEYSDLQDYDSVTIGDHCMLSGWRRKHSRQPDDEKSLTIPNGMSVQLLPMASEANGEERFVIMALGTTDSIKSSITESELYGVPFLEVLNRTGVTPKEFGFGEKAMESDSIWTAKIHPIVSTNDSSALSFSSYFGWVEPLRENDSDLRNNKSFCNWLSAERVSLREIHGIANASSEWAFRIHLEKEIWWLNCQMRIKRVIKEGFMRFAENDYSLDDPTEKLVMKRTDSIVLDKYVLSMAPVRVDLAGGWSDTPPITYEYGGSVTGMAVLVDGCFPLSCRCRLVTGKCGISLKSELRGISSGSLLSTMQDEITEMSQLADYCNPSASCALLKAALVCLGMVSHADLQNTSTDLQKLINDFCSVSEGDVRIEIITTSLLGMGTGMGTSSILGACILQSVGKCVGLGTLSEECLIHGVLFLEQLLSSGGGWQDQAHGILPGIKTVTSAPKLPLEFDINPVEMSKSNLMALEERLLFAYTGKTRLAKNILQQVLRRWSRRTNKIVKTVKGLVDHSVAVRKALETNALDDLGKFMYQAHKLKCVMAGEDSGAEPESVKQFVSEMVKANQIRGAMLCGAGGGGFLLLLLSDGADRKSVERIFETNIAPQNSEFEDFRFHDCTIAKTGLSTTILHDDTMNEETYNLSWQRLPLKPK